VVISYALSMIPEWKRTLRLATDPLAPDGDLHVVDFSDQAELPDWFRQGLFAWLKYFSVTPRPDLCTQLNDVAHATGQTCRARKLYKGYAMLGEFHIQ